MENRDGEIHVETDEARGASTNNIVRWILVVSLFAAIALLSVIWITGAATQGDEEDEVSVDAMAGDPAASDSDDTDSIVDEGFDELPDTAEEGGTDVAQPTVENEADAPEPAAAETDAN